MTDFPREITDEPRDMVYKGKCVECREEAKYVDQREMDDLENQKYVVPVCKDHAEGV